MCVLWMVDTTNGSMNLDRCWKIRKAAKSVMRIAETCLNTSIECQSVHQQKRDSSLKKQVYALRSGEPMCHDASRKALAKKLKHMQDNVFEVPWLSEVKFLTKVRSKWLQDMNGDAVKAKFVAQ